MNAAAALVCTSHTPLMDFVQPKEGVRGKVDAVFSAIRSEIEDFAPSMIALFAPDHFRGFFYDAMPPFCVGVRAEMLRDFGIGEGDMHVPSDLAEALVRHLHSSGIDSAISYRMALDHGFAQPLQLLAGGVGKSTVLPIFVNCAAKPLPPFHRVRALGSAVGKWLQASSGKVLIIGSGGLSHDPPVPQLGTAPPEVEEMLICGRNPTAEMAQAREMRVIQNARDLAEGRGRARPLNECWDRQFLHNLIVGDLSALDDVDDALVTNEAGVGGHEVRTWIAAAAAANELGVVECRVRFYEAIPEWNAGMGVVTGDITP